MYKAPACFLLRRNPSPCAASLAEGSKPTRLSMYLYESWYRASFQPKFYRGRYNIICLNCLHSPSQRNINGDLGPPLVFRITKRSLASSSASNLASAFSSRSSATSVVSTLVPLSARDQALVPEPLFSFSGLSCSCSVEADGLSLTESLPVS